LGSGIDHHFGHGYAVTSHSSPGATADRVLVHVDTEQARGQLVNPRLACVLPALLRDSGSLHPV
jgi:hypothetical protein